MIQEHYAIPDSKEVVKATAIVSKGLRSQLRGVPTGAKDFNVANVFRSMSSQWYQKKKNWSVRRCYFEECNKTQYSRIHSAFAMSPYGKQIDEGMVLFT